MAEPNRFAWDAGQVVWDFGHLAGGDKKHPKIPKAFNPEVEKDRSGEPGEFADVAERPVHHTGEHLTPMASGNIQKQKTDAHVADRMGYGDTPVIQPATGLNPFEDGRADKAEIAERQREREMEEREGRMKSEVIEKATPESGESQEKFMDRCIHQLIGEGRSPQKGADMCYAIWHRSKGTSRKSQDGYAVKKASLVRLVTKGAIHVAGMFVRKGR